jgi:SPFH domain / Band 7 family
VSIYVDQQLVEANAQFHFYRTERRSAMFSDSYLLYLTPALLLFAFIIIGASVRILREYERAVVFTLGRFQRVKGPGLVLLIPFFQEMVRVDLESGSPDPGHRNTHPGRHLSRQHFDEG